MEARKDEKAGVGDRVEQLDLLRKIMEDPDAHEAFPAMSLPGAKLELRRESDEEGKATS
ncbi:hypothetical protein [Streptomyces sp. E-08]|uniref:hypothetical protein n=1 Tax=Streptomyces sp. E-08 TaxID=3404047 RepID=UPI003CFA538F